jgi:tetratricopeptide (TPR) repeat protein
MGKAVAIFSFLTVFVITACTQLGISDISLLKRRGLAYMRTKRYDLALNDFYSAITLRPDAESFAYQGDALYNLGKPELALESYAASIRRNQLWMWPYIDRGELYLDHGDYALAMQDFDTAVILAPTYPIGWSDRCRTEAIIGQLQKAVDDCTRALALDDDFVNEMVMSGNVAVAQDRGLAYLKMGRFDLAIRDYNKALKLVPKSAEALFGRGIAKQNSDDYAGASADVSAAETLDPHIKDVFLRWNVSLSVLQHSSVKQDGGREKTQTL